MTMTTLTVSDFAELTKNWAIRRDDGFKYYWPVKGGWEGWIQVDLTAYVLSIDSSVEILREQQVYTSGKRVDLLLNASHDFLQQIPVEIKAESFQNTDNFLTGVLKDLEKISRDRKDEYRQSTCVVLAVPFSPERLQEIEGVTYLDYPIFRRVFVGEVACAVAVWTADRWLRRDEALPSTAVPEESVRR